MAGTIGSGNFGHIGRPGQVGGSIATRPNASKSDVQLGLRSLKRETPVCPSLEELMAERFRETHKKKPTKKQMAAMLAAARDVLMKQPV